MTVPGFFFTKSTNPKEVNKMSNTDGLQYFLSPALRCLDHGVQVLLAQEVCGHLFDQDDADSAVFGLAVCAAQDYLLHVIDVLFGECDAMPGEIHSGEVSIEKVSVRIIDSRLGRFPECLAVKCEAGCFRSLILEIIT